MKRLMQGAKLIGEYEDDWQPPDGCDMAVGLKDKSMAFVAIASDEIAARAKVERAAQIRALLFDIDMRSIRPARAGDSPKLVLLEGEAAALRSELQGLK